MWRGLLLSILLAGCVPLPPTPQDIQAKKFERVPDKSVIYVIRNNPDASTRGTTLVVDDAMGITTFSGTYIRWEVAPGTHTIRGLGADSGATKVNSEAGRIYYVLQDTSGGRTPMSRFQMLNEQQGQAAVQRSVRVVTGQTEFGP
jgi:hypothetical protein